MNILFALVIGILFGTGAFLMMKRDLIRVVLGVILILNAVNLFIKASGLSRGSPPILPLEPEGNFSDPLVQALALTAIVISFGITTLILILVYRVYTTHQSIDQDVLREAEEHEMAEPERTKEVS